MAGLVPTSRSNRRTHLELSDLCCTISAPWLAFALRDPALFGPDSVEQVSIYCGVALVAGIASLYISQIGDGIPLEICPLHRLDIITCSFSASTVAVVTAFLVTRLDWMPRSLPIIHFFVLTSLLLTSRFIRHWLMQQSQPKHGDIRRKDTKNIIVLGANRLASLYMQVVETFSLGDQKVIAVLDANPKLRNRMLNGRQIIGTPDDLPSIADEYKIHGVDIHKVVIATDRSELSRTVWDCLNSAAPMEIEFLAERIGFAQQITSGPSDQTQLAAALPLELDAIILKRSKYWKVKRLIDVIIASTLLVILMPLIATIAIFVRVWIGSPVIFWQRRVGRNGKPFFIFKFRTLLAPYDEHGRPRTEAKRFSKAGSFLRRTRLDELPQLLNVLRGEMSIIGPRPLLPIDQPPGAGTRLLISPGITGWAQVHGGIFLSQNEKNTLDEYYIRNASFWLDFKILLKTAKVLFAGDCPLPEIVDKARCGAPRKVEISSIVPRETKPAQKFFRSHHRA